MRALELFSGTGSVGRALRAAGWEVISLDLLPKFRPSICCDILDWDYKQWPQGHFDFIWASPPCTQYSRARTTAHTPRDLEGADAIVQRTLDIIEWYQPRAWLMENPATGLLTKRSVVAGLPYRDVTYCRYGARYQKATRLWGACPNFKPKHCRDQRCESWCGGHPEDAQRFTQKLETLYALPPRLCQEIVECL
jgi:site-specific DNA-cytosine methylase